ncbi:hypothetical protein ACJRO7_017425 [Eucalyptus globulus]|uniref:LysM domain-containing protein n=1 Tax=Eucalyptus globulus TaxID=34317 RepID=A0ABD3KUF4_EUCGL
MARLGNKMTMLFNLLLVLSLLLSVYTARELRSSSKSWVGAQCHSVYGVQGNESCDDVMLKFNLNYTTFRIFNINLDCGRLYSGQWLCINNTTLY